MDKGIKELGNKEKDCLNNHKVNLPIVGYLKILNHILPPAQ